MDEKFVIRTSVLLLFLLCFASFSTGDEYLSTPNYFKLRFITGSTMGDLPGREAYLGWFFEAIHSLPSNETSYEYPPLVSRNLDREMVYKAMVSKIKARGYPGKSCLLRTICEVAMHSVEKANGILGDLLHIVLTPSTTKNIGLSREYSEAEHFGRKRHDCTKYYTKCTTSFIDLVSWIDDVL